MYNPFNKLIKNRVKEKRKNIISVETNFPQKIPNGFTNSSINFLLNSDISFTSYTAHEMSRKGFCNPIGISVSDFELNKKGYLNYYDKSFDNELRNKIKFLNSNSKIQADLAHTTFLSQAYVLSPLFLKMKIPFAFTLFEGGGFGLNNSESDACLKDIFSNKFFRKVIVNSDVTYDYLLKKRFCKESKIELLHGTILQFDETEIDIQKKRFYKKNKSTFDICFVAYNYGDKGRSKGYDLFIESIFNLCDAIDLSKDDIRFHVVGNYDENIIDVSKIGNRIKFYGPKDPKWLANFYYNMDITIDPVRPFTLYPGSFDGYPMGIEQSLFGVAMFTSDELNQNRNYTYYKNDEIVHVNLDANDISSKVIYYLKNLNNLYQLAEKGRKRTLSFNNLTHRMNRFIAILKSCI